MLSSVLPEIKKSDVKVFLQNVMFHCIPSTSYSKFVFDFKKIMFLIVPFVLP